MKREIQRQLIHLSATLLVILAQFTGQAVAYYSIFIAGMFFVYSLYIRHEKERLMVLNRVERKFRELVTGVDRDNTSFRFSGAVWLFLSLGVLFIVFPLHIASAAGIMLTVGDSLSALVGMHLGKHRILPGKSVEGSAAFFVGCLAAVLFIQPGLVLPAAFLATLVELVPAFSVAGKWRKMGLVDDNWMVPLFVGLFLYIMPLAGLF